MGILTILNSVLPEIKMPEGRIPVTFNKEMGITVERFDPYIKWTVPLKTEALYPPTYLTLLQQFQDTPTDAFVATMKGLFAAYPPFYTGSRQLKPQEKAQKIAFPVISATSPYYPFITGTCSFEEFALSLLIATEHLHYMQDRLFDTPRHALMQYLENVTIFRILVEATKTPANLYINAKNKVFFFMPSGVVTANEEVKLLPSYQNVSSSKARAIYYKAPVDAINSGTAAGFTTRIPASVVAEAIWRSYHYLKESSIEPFEIPASEGGGKKYLMLLSSSVMLPPADSYPADSILPVVIPKEMFWYVQAQPMEWGGFYLMGYPGIFRFTPEQSYEVRLSNLASEYGKLETIGWDDYSVYVSARAPKGAMTSVTLNVIPELFAASQDTVRCVLQASTAPTLKGSR